MQLTQTTALAIVRALDRALDALRDLDAHADALEHPVDGSARQLIRERLIGLSICVEAASVAARMAADETAVNSGASDRAK